MNPKVTKILGLLGIFLIVSGISYFLFDYFLPSGSGGLLKSFSQRQPSSDQNQDQNPAKPELYPGPKTEACPLNGKLYTKEEKDTWSGRRPLMVMIENHQDSRPQSGLQTADIVYEAVAEGGITRFMGVFYCGQVAGSEANKYDVGPVRSARTYFLDIASEYSDYPLYNHVGGANCSAATPGGPCTTAKKAQAIEQISAYGWTNKGTWGDLSQFSLPYKVCRREPDRTGQERATEHTMYCSTKELWNIASTRGLTNLTEAKKTSWDKNYRSWLFKQTDQAAASPTATKVTFDFWSGYKDYTVVWNYDAANNNYVRTNGSVVQTDFNTDTSLTAKNIIIQLVKESRSIDEHMHNLYDVVGSGSGVLIQNGEKTDITWSKTNRVSRTIYKDKSGKEVNFIPGNIWVELLPTTSTVSYN
ncbi:MAG TPA: DUF3048 domain-containing protein [Candidatus Woesebacteria bacterium]|nr:DUF3048 domain-containing protein [Candidatus Woesebacteria bacterium]HOG37815.1 DUF3048 domain-containing protein [Candidatus Woesebacteria bacterium]